MNVWESLGRAIHAEMVDGLLLVVVGKKPLAADARTSPVWANTPSEVNIRVGHVPSCPKGPIGPMQVTGFLLHPTAIADGGTTWIEVQVLVNSGPGKISPWRADHICTSRKEALKHLKELTELWESEQKEE